jgi:hypothetical protein
MRIYPRSHTVMIRDVYYSGIFTGLANTPEFIYALFPENFWFTNQAQAVIHVYCKRLPPFPYLHDPGKFNEICLLEIAMQIHFNFVRIIPSTLFQHFIIVLGLIYCR